MATATVGRPRPHVIGRAPRTDEELWEYVATLWGVQIPRDRCCADHQSPFEAFAHAFFARSRVAVWVASRGFGGKSFLLATLGLTEQVALGAYVAILGGSGQQSERVHEYMRKHWEFPVAPRGLLLDDPTARETKLRNGGHVKALMASAPAVRGPHPSRLRLDEADEMDLAIFDAAMGQPMSTSRVPAQTVIASTHHYPDGTMTEILRRAAERVWPVFTWCYRETVEPHGWLPTAEIEAKRQEVTAQMFANEYDLQEPSPESRAIQPSAIAQAFSAELGEFAGADHEAIEAEPPQPGGRYVHGADWAKQQDHTVVVTLRTDCRPVRLVAFERVQRRPWPVMVALLDQRIDRYGGEAAHDNTGLGQVVADLLHHDVRPVMMVGRDRQDLLTDYVGAIERNEIRFPDIRWMHGEHKFATVRDLYGTAGQGHTPDSVVAGALAWHLAVPRDFGAWSGHYRDSLAMAEAQETREYPGAGLRNPDETESRPTSHTVVTMHGDDEDEVNARCLRALADLDRGEPIAWEGLAPLVAARLDKMLGARVLDARNGADTRIYVMERKRYALLTSRVVQTDEDLRRYGHTRGSR